MALTKVAPAGIGSTPGDGYRIGNSFLHSTGLDITNINATGILTAASLDISGAIDFDGHTELDNVNISGVSTFAGNIDANGDLDVDGHTNLDNVSIAGVVTATTFSGSGANLTALNASNISSGTVPIARLGSGTASSSKFLRGDSTFQNISTLFVNLNHGQNFLDDQNLIFGDASDTSKE